MRKSASAKPNRKTVVDRLFLLSITHNNNNIMSTAGRITDPGKLSEFFKFSRLSNFNFALDIPTTMWYNKLGEAKLSDNSELSEYSDVYSIPYFVYSIRTCVRIT